MQTPLVDIHTHLSAPEGTVALCNYSIGTADELTTEPCTNPTTRYSAGIHPWACAELTTPALEKSALERLEQTIERPSVVALGEVGLDFARTSNPQLREQQLRIFTAQLHLGASLHLPVVLHLVRATERALPLLRNYPAPLIIHGFVGSAELAQQLLHTHPHLYLSFGHRLLSSPKTEEALRALPSDRLFLESDTQPSSTLFELYTQTATLRECTPCELRTELYRNFQTLFPDRL